jgi:hypothetical protein
MLHYLAGIRRMPALLTLSLPLSTDFGNVKCSTGALVHPSQRHRRTERRKCGFCCHPDAPLLWFLIGRKTIKRFTSIRLPVVAAIPRPAPGCRQTDFAGWRLGHLECDIAPVADDLRTDLDQLLFQGRHRPVLDRLWRRQRAQKVAERRLRRPYPSAHMTLRLAWRARPL